MQGPKLSFLCWRQPATGPKFLVARWQFLVAKIFSIFPLALKDKMLVVLVYFWPFFRLFCLVTRKMVRIGIIGLALSDPHFCILSRDCFNLSREYFSLWVIKTSLDRNASAVLERKCYFHASLVI